MKPRPPVLRVANRINNARYWGLRGFPGVTLYAAKWDVKEPVRWWLAFDIPQSETAYAELKRVNARQLLKLAKPRYSKARRRRRAA